MPVQGQQQRKCAYSRTATQYGVTYVAEEYARSLVLGNRLDEVLNIHRAGHTEVSTVLDYSAKRGRHAMTQSLVAEGITVTRDALQAAAKLGGPGVDLLLAGVIEGDQLDMARQDALHARLLFGEFGRAMDLLEAGVRPSPECYNALAVGARRKLRADEDWRPLCHPMLDAMLPQTLIEHFTEHTVEAVLLNGRPIHIERMLEIMKLQPADMFPECLRHRAMGAIGVLRTLGLRMDEPTFLKISKRLQSDQFLYRLNLGPMLDCYVAESGQTMKAATVTPLLLSVLCDQEHFLRGSTDTRPEETYRRINTVVLPYLSIMDATEHLKLYDVIDRWAVQCGGHKPIPPTLTASIKHVILVANQMALEQVCAADGDSPSP